MGPRSAGPSGAGVACSRARALRRVPWRCALRCRYRVRCHARGRRPRRPGRGGFCTVGTNSTKEGCREARFVVSRRRRRVRRRTRWPNACRAVVVAKSCSSAYKHAVMPDRSHKCLRAGQFCSRRASYQRVYTAKASNARRLSIFVVADKALAQELGEPDRVGADRRCGDGDLVALQRPCASSPSRSAAM